MFFRLHGKNSLIDGNYCCVIDVREWQALKKFKIKHSQAYVNKKLNKLVVFLLKHQ